MGKKILVLTGSPRKGGNSDALVNAFTRGAIGTGHTVARFDAAVNTVQGCRACNACWSKGEACVFDDGFRKLAPMLIEAEVLVLASPVYFFGMTAQIKAAVDKFYSFMAPASPHKLRLQEAVLLMTAEDDRPEVYKGSIATYKGICDYLQLENRAMITVLGVNHVGDISGNAALAEAEKLGAAL